MNLLDAFELAQSYHGRQVDKNGDPYIAHLMRVMLRVQLRGGTHAQQIAALLHDSIEDGYASAPALLRNEVPKDAVEIVEALTRKEGQAYQDYIASLASTREAILVKQCDIEDNLQPSRLHRLPEPDSFRLRCKYTWALTALDAAAADADVPGRDRPSQ